MKPDDNERARYLWRPRWFLIEKVVDAIAIVPIHFTDLLERGASQSVAPRYPGMSRIGSIFRRSATR